MLSYDEIWVSRASNLTKCSTDKNGQYLIDRVGCNPDTYLDELRIGLSEVCDKDVSISTVWRTLQRCGFRLKKVRLYFRHSKNAN